MNPKVILGFVYFFNLRYFIKVGIFTAQTIMAIKINNNAKVLSVDPTGEYKIFSIEKEIKNINAKSLNNNILLK